jgi:hypothetical protein
MTERAKELAMARKAFIARGFWPNEVMWACWRDAWLAGSAIEREACAKVCEQFQKDYVYTADLAGAVAAIKHRMADAIRARGNT